MMQQAPVRLSELPSYLTYILLNPAFDPKAAFLAYAIVAILLLLLLSVGVIILMGGKGSAPSRRAEPASSPRPPGRRLRALTVAACVLAAVWVLTGYTTADPGLCKSCHWASAEHAKAAPGTDPHAGLSCVACHEPQGPLGRYVTAVPARLAHLAESQAATTGTSEYGRVTGAACSSCHRGTLTGLTTDKARGLRMSHAEPLAASATCLDCHRFRDGVVGTHNAGMRPCGRCHDAKLASAECATCHDEKAAYAARASKASFAKPQVGDPECGGCHDEARECDGCHGLRMPHSTEFKSYAHARAAAVDFWFTGGKTCSRCHTAEKHPCAACHGSLLGSGHGGGSSMAQAHKTATSAACDKCHSRLAYTATRDFCADLCHSPAAMAESPH